MLAIVVLLLILLFLLYAPVSYKLAEYKFVKTVKEINKKLDKIIGTIDRINKTKKDINDNSF